MVKRKRTFFERTQFRSHRITRDIRARKYCRALYSLACTYYANRRFKAFQIEMLNISATFRCCKSENRIEIKSV